jgi:hypothetical protein
MPPRMSLSVLFAAGVLSWATTSAAADGAYGRIDGDTAIQLDVGSGTDDGRACAVAAIAVRYLQTAGVYNTWAIRPRDDRPSAWTSSFGVELRPLFLPRFFKDLQSGPAALDLMLDSLSLRLGAVTAKDGPFSTGGPGFESGVGIGVPLTSQASGLWLSTAGTLRWSHVRMGGSPSDQDRTFLWTLTLGWQEIFRLGIVDVGDTNPP